MSARSHATAVPKAVPVHWDSHQLHHLRRGEQLLLGIVKAVKAIESLSLTSVIGVHRWTVASLSDDSGRC
jgi:hypothetical protein